MKKLLALVLCCALLLGCAACSGEPEPTGTTEPTVSNTVKPSSPNTNPGGNTVPVPVVTQELKEKLDAVLEQKQYQGIVYLTHNGQVLYQSVHGTNDLGQPLTIQSPMFVGSVSKQFCAAAVIILRDQGKLSVEDTLDKYFPEFTAGKDITVKHLLTMRSGLPEFLTHIQMNVEDFENNTGEETLAAIQSWLYDQPLRFSPDSRYEYINTNYFLLGLIVEQVSGQSYNDFVREHIFEPVGMVHTGFVSEVGEQPAWAEGLTYDKLQAADQIDLIAQGAGDITSTASDLDKWMTALQSGKVVCMDSYREMITDYSTEDITTSYGYGLMRDLRGGVWHGGAIGSYTSRLYFHEEHGFQFFISTGTDTDKTAPTADALLRTLFEAVEKST